jgi:hypothetical protein
MQKPEAILCGEHVTFAVKSYVEVGVKLPPPRRYEAGHRLSVASIKKLRSAPYDETSEKLVRWKK